MLDIVYLANSTARHRQLPANHYKSTMQMPLKSHQICLINPRYPGKVQCMPPRKPHTCKTGLTGALHPWTSPIPNEKVTIHSATLPCANPWTEASRDPPHRSAYLLSSVRAPRSLSYRRATRPLSPPRLSLAPRSHRPQNAQPSFLMAPTSQAHPFVRSQRLNS